MLIPGRKFSAGNVYRYGFNGKENDNDVKGEGNSLDFGGRIYDPRVSRWLSVDPLANKFPNESPYIYAGNNSIFFIDPDGEARIVSITINNQQTGEKLVLTLMVSDEIKSKANIVREKCGTNGCEKITNRQHGYNWHDIKETINITIDKDGKRSVSRTEELGDKKTTTDYNWEWWAKIKVDEGYLNESPKDKKLSSRGGSVLYSKYGKNGETTVSTSMDIDMTEVEGLIGMLNLGAGNSLDKDNLIKKLNSLLSYEKNTDKINEKIEKIMNVLGLNDAEPEKPANTVGVDPVFKKPGNVVYRRDGGLKTEVIDSTKAQTTQKPATDTFPSIKKNP